MGNTKSAESKSGAPSTTGPESPRHLNPRIDACGDPLATNLWKYLGEDSVSPEDSMSIDVFGRHALSLVGTSTDVYVMLLMPVHHLLRVCFEAAGVEAVQGDQKFISLLVEEMESTGKETENIVQWNNSICPKLCSAVQAKVLNAFYGILEVKKDYSSDILSPAQMFYLQSCLPSKFFPSQGQGEENEQTRHWTPLYTSAEQGISVNRFETNVFDYRGATVAIFKLTDGGLVAVAIDQEWRHSAKRFGGPLTALYHFFPTCKRIECAGAVYCNLKLRSAFMGLSFDKFLSIDKGMNNVAAIEVWGCSGATTLQEQQKLKQWQSRQVEKNKRVPLPGNWDENPDKTLLEMAGFTFSSERRDEGPRGD
ncbi:hypothetical protein QR680_012637 [Steinernema hermaphroditum]|uniref:TLDc domain-containing protein n=1 Tax=Steinernema hermaphroditum TaxID=289476 RepID=A0AA39I4Y7_9BILA|nr:hypothetical protein QR680_012637 [Steinernema hermaphroditum]